MAEKTTSNLEGGLDANRGDSVLACAIIFIVSCSLVLVLRFVSQRITRRGVFLEDWLMVAAYFLMMGLCSNVICSMNIMSSLLCCMLTDLVGLKAWYMAM